MHTGVGMVMTSGALCLWHHGPLRTVSGIKGSTTPASGLRGTPSSLAGKDIAMETIKGTGASTIDKGDVAHQRNVVEAEIPDGSKRHAV